MLLLVTGVPRLPAMLRPALPAPVVEARHHHPPHTWQRALTGTRLLPWLICLWPELASQGAAGRASDPLCSGELQDTGSPGHAQVRAWQARGCALWAR